MRRFTDLFAAPRVSGAVLAVALAVALGGCAKSPGDFSIVPEPKKVQVNAVNLVHTVSFPPAATHLGEVEGQAIDAFLDKVEPGWGDEIYLYAGAQPNPVDRRRLSALASYLELIGVESRIALAGLDLPENEANTVRLVVRRWVASVPDCPDWTSDPTNDYNNVPYSNFGCATATNLSLMVANPRDLVRGQTPAPANGVVQAATIQRYHNRNVEPIWSLDVGAFETERSAQEENEPTQ